MHRRSVNRDHQINQGNIELLYIRFRHSQWKLVTTGPSCCISFEIDCRTHLPPQASSYIPVRSSSYITSRSLGHSPPYLSLHVPPGQDNRAFLNCGEYRRSYYPVAALSMRSTRAHASYHKGILVPTISPTQSPAPVHLTLTQCRLSS